MRILHSKKLIFISKPRCGSTSVRRFLDSKMIDGDEMCDYAGEYPNHPDLHPHMSAPAIYEYLKAKGIDAGEYRIFTVIRKPIDMLWSYFNYFEPDVNSNYNYSPMYNKNNRASFEEWLNNGHVGLGLWKKYCPGCITSDNFTPLSLEAHSFDRNSNAMIDKVFMIESIDD